MHIHIHKHIHIHMPMPMTHDTETHTETPQRLIDTQTHRLTRTHRDTQRHTETHETHETQETQRHTRHRDTVLDDDSLTNVLLEPNKRSPNSTLDHKTVRAHEGKLVTTM